jgi:hypothetical protein
MAGLYDWQTRVGRLQDQLNQIDSLVNTYANTERSTGELVNKVTQIQDRVGQQENRIEAAEQSAATYDREFLERKELMPSTFQKDRLYTLQDFSFFFFFVSYLIFALAISMTVEEKAKTLGSFFIAGLVISLVILRYA